MIRTRLSAWVFLAASAAMTAAPAAPSFAQTVREGAVAVVNDEVISTYDLRQRMLLMIGRSGIKPTAENQAELQEQALQGLIDDRLKLQELKRLEKDRKAEGKIIVQDDEVDNEISQMAERNKLTPAQYMQVLSTWGVNAQSERSRIKADKSWSYWIGGFYGRRVKVSPSEVDSYIAQLAARAAKPGYEVSEIFIDAGRAGGIDKAMQLATQLIGQLQQGAPFQSVATQFSGVPTSANGGDAGWLTAGELPAEVEAVLTNLRPGQLSRPIAVSDGAYIIYLRDKRVGGGQPVVNLKQVAVSLSSDAPAAQVAAAQQKLLALKPKITSCANLETVAGSVEGVAAGDLGEAEVKDLAPGFREAAERLAVNQVSDPIRTEVGLHLIAVCGRRDTAVELPSREEVQSELENEKLNLIAKREMMNLRTSATIDRR